MIFYLLILQCYCQNIIYSNTFQNETTITDITLNSSLTYLIQLEIYQFPQDQRYSLYLTVTNQNENQQLQDNIGFYTKSQLQQVYVNSTTLITIDITYKKICNYTIQGLSNYNYTIIIYQTNYSTQNCLFSQYGQNCTQYLTQLDLSTQKITISSQNWFYYYYKLTENNDYQLSLTNNDSNIGISIVPLGKSNYTQLPAFNNKFSLIPQNYYYNVNLTRVTNIIDYYIIVIGIYNFNSTQSYCQITLQKIQENDNDLTFPLWAILTLIFVILLMLFVSIFLICYLRKQHKIIHQESYAIQREFLDKYMPSKKLQVLYLNETCCICLIQYQIDTYIRESPCRHLFHSECLQEWTKKQASCPMCRLDFNEQTLTKLIQTKQTEGSPIADKKQYCTFLQQEQSTNEQNRNFNLEDSSQQLRQINQTNNNVTVQPFSINNEINQQIEII